MAKTDWKAEAKALKKKLKALKDTVSETVAPVAEGVQEKVAEMAGEVVAAGSMNSCHNSGTWLIKIHSIKTIPALSSQQTTAGGPKPGNWFKHGLFTSGSNNTWLLTLGPLFEAKGMVRNKQDIFSEQLAQTIAGLLGYTFATDHPVADPLALSNVK